MGQILSEPVTEKHTESGESERRVVYGLSAMQGWRLSMEDAHTAVLELPATDGGASADAGTNAFFAVFDGHGGDRVAIYAGRRLHTLLASMPEYGAGDYAHALAKAYLTIDEEMRQAPELSGDPSGCTAVSCLVTRDRLFCANSGDSRCILGKQGRPYVMSTDHKPSLKSELDRIVAAGGFVNYGRVNGNLALSRALGDFGFKGNPSLPAEKQVVTAFPEITEHALTDDVDFVVIACDGIWDCMTNEQVVAFVHKRLAEGKELTTVSEELIDNCLAPDGFIGAVGCDNMSAIIVGLLHGKTKAEWVEQLRSTVDKIPEHSGGAPSSDDKPAIADTAPTSTPATTAATAAAAISTPTAAEIDLA